MRIVIFIQTPDINDELHTIWCVECYWAWSYNERLWTSNAMPDEQRRAFLETKIHARRQHHSRARIVRGWVP